MHTISSQNLGTHCILELYQCDYARLNDEAFISTTISISAKLAGATLLNLISHPFNPQGITCLALLAESHISIHTWPEVGYAAVDIFTCGIKTLPEKACEVMITEFESPNYSLKSFRRDTPKKIGNLIRRPED